MGCDRDRYPQVNPDLVTLRVLAKLEMVCQYAARALFRCGNQQLKATNSHGAIFEII